MNTLKKTVSKAFSASVVFMTVFSMLGLGALVPVGALAAVDYSDAEDVEAGDIIEHLGAVYYINDNMELVYFPRDLEFYTWYDDFSEVLHLEASTNLLEYFGEPTLGEESLGITYRSSCKLVKRAISPSTYVILPGNEVAELTSGEVAADLYGSNWPSYVADVDTAFWSNYTNNGATVDASVPHEGMIVMVEGDNTQYIVSNGMYSELDGEDDSCAHTVSQEVFDELEISGDTVTFESLRSEPDQSEGGSSTSTDDPDVDEDEATGNLTFSLSAQTPETTLVPNTATHVKYLAFNVTAGSEDAHLDSVTFERFGLGDRSNFDKVWLAVDGVSVSQEKSIQSSNSQGQELVELRPNYDIAAGQTVTFWFMANLDSSTSNPDGTEQDAFKVVSVEANGADVSGAAGVDGNFMIYSTYSLGTATISQKGTAQEVEVGDEEEIIGEFEIDWSSANDNLGYFKSVRFKMEGTAEMSDLANWELHNNTGGVVSGEVNIWGDYITFMIADDFQMLEDGDSERYEIRADLIDGDDTETIIMELEDNRDFYFKEGTVNVGSKIGTSLTGTGSRRLQIYTIDAGQFTVSLNGSETPTNEQYSKATNDIVALVADLDLGQCITVDGLDLYFSSDSVINDNSASTGDESAVIEADIERAELWIVRADGDLDKVGSETTVSGTQTENDTIATDETFFDFTETFELYDNDMLKLVLDLENDATTNTYKFTFTNSGSSSNFDDPEYCEGGDNVDDTNKTGVVTGNEVQITAAAVTITRNDGYSTGETFVVGSEDQMFFQFLVDAGTASGVVVETLKFDLDTVADATFVTDNYTKFTNFYLMVDGQSVRLSDLEDMQSDGTFTFNNLSLDIPESDQVVVGLYGDLQNSVEATSSLQWTLQSSSNGSVINDLESDAITFSAATSALLTTSAGGTLTVSIDGDTADATIYAVGSTGTRVTRDIATFKLVAEDDIINVTDLYFANNSSTANADTIETGADFLISKYQLVVDGQVVDEKVPASGKVHFELDGTDEISIPKDTTKRATVRAVFNHITDEAQTGNRIALALYAIEAESDGPGTSLSSVTGVSTTETPGLAALDQALTGELMAIYQSIPTIAGLSLAGTTLNSGTQDIYKFSVAADSLGDVSFAQVSIDLTGECRTNQSAAQCITDINLYELTTGGNREEISISFVTSSNSTSASEIKIGISSSSPNDIQTITAGTAKTYLVEATFSGIQAADSISVRMRDHTSAHQNKLNLGTALTAAGSTGAIVWADNSGVDAEASETHWFIGRDVPGLDTLLVTFEKAS